MRTTVTAALVRKLFDYDSATGVFTWRKDRVREDGWVLAKAGDVAGGLDVAGYWRLCILGHQYSAHRVAVLYMTGSWPAAHVDHKNGGKSDNRWENLRDVSRSVNLQNRQGAQKNSRTGLLGATYYPTRDKYCARLSVCGVYKNLGYFETAEAAHQAYLTAKRVLHAGCTI